MTQSFHVRIEDVKLRGQEPRNDVPPASASTDAVRGAFFLETFGCQMNDHDSEKVAGVLLSRGYRQVETPEAASLKRRRRKFFRGSVNIARSRATGRSSGCSAASRSKKANRFLSAPRGSAWSAGPQVTASFRKCWRNWRPGITASPASIPTPTRRSKLR